MALGPRCVGAIAWSVLLGLAACGDDGTVGVTGSEGTGDTVSGSSSEPSDPPGTSDATRGPSVDSSSTAADDTDVSASETSTSATSTSEPTTGQTTTGQTTTSVEPSCGDGIVDDAEACDDAGESPSCDVDCTPAACGDATLNVAAGEQCDGAELGGIACEDLGYDAGTLACSDACAHDTSACFLLPGAPVLQLGFSPIKRFDFTWAAVAGADHYQLLESVAPGEPFVPLGGDILGESISLEMPLHLRHDASYVLRACNGGGCTDSAAVDVMGSLVEAVGYIKASNTATSDRFGERIALSGDGNTLAVGAPGEDGSATGIGGDQASNGASASGAVYVFVRDGVGTWSQQAYVKASNTGANDWFGQSVSLSADGNTLAVGAHRESSSATGIGGDQANDAATQAGAAYVFVRDGAGAWSQQAYVKASNTGPSDHFGQSVALSSDGSTLAVGAPGEDGSATGVGGDQANDGASGSGAVYVLVRDDMGAWSQQAYVKPSNTAPGDPLVGFHMGFGESVALSAAGDTLAVGASGEASNATGIDGDQTNGSIESAGAVYVLVRSGMGAWSQQAYVKASNTGQDAFGRSVALSANGDVLAVGAPSEDGNAIGVDGDQTNDDASGSGAVYVLTRDAADAWSHRAYVKASNTGASDQWGLCTALSSDGSTLAVSTYQEDGGATGIGGNPLDDSAPSAGAAYLY